MRRPRLRSGGRASGGRRRRRPPAGRASSGRIWRRGPSPPRSRSAAAALHLGDDEDLLPEGPVVAGIRPATVTLACSEEPISPERRSSSSMPVAVARVARSAAQRSASASSRHSAGSTGKSCRCTLSVSLGKRDSQASSAVKASTGASQAQRQRCSTSSTVRALRRRWLSGRVAVQRVLADVEVEGREVGAAEAVDVRVDAGPVVVPHRLAQPRVQLGQPVQHPALQLRQLGIGHPSRPRRSRRGCRAASAACCAAGGTAPPAASGSPCRCGGRRRCRSSSPRAAGCRRRTASSPPAGR